MTKITVEDAKKHVVFGWEQAKMGKSGTAQTIISENAWPWITRMSFCICRLEPNMPRFNIDWDTRSSNSGNIVAMGSFDFDSLEEGAEKLAKEINDEVPDYAWMTDEEHAKLKVDIKQEFQEFFDTHCDLEKGDCPDRWTCKVRWPGGFGLQGCSFEHDDKKRILG